ncbi:MAG: glycoside hydrolase family 2 protein [Tannerellaceae bacterium]|jgi:beta-galactosidase|nr:glycoside hydrolase family 2 protein [Tannerellaceae bacterium]
MIKHLAILFLVTACAFHAQATPSPEYSTAGFFPLNGTGREVYSMNPAWRFHKGAASGAESKHFDDSGWAVVSLPHGIEYLPTEASGCINYQGEVWYRKHFTLPAGLENKHLFLHFEAIMGKCKVFVNGKLVTEHFGGYLPVIADITESVNWEGDNVIVVWADNSDDPLYPPGKQQSVLDFTYFGGIYRDCWLIAHNNIFITDPNYENEIAGGGLFVAYNNVSDFSADVLLKIHVRNSEKHTFAGAVEYKLLQQNGTQVAQLKLPIRIQANKSQVASGKITVKNPLLWHPDAPALYYMQVRILDKNGNVVDGYRQRIGIRSIEFKGKDGFWLNNKPYGKPLMGANRHQDFAVVGNAVPNSVHWRDAKKLKEAGLNIIRNAHYPQDPAFMDACDELGLFVIVNTPGWQFWNNAPIFEQRVYSDIRNIVRRDRNHPSVWLWEPILNETGYPAAFAQNAKECVDSEYPYPYSYSGCDSRARGYEYFPVLFTHPQPTRNTSVRRGEVAEVDSSKTYFTREWGDNVDDWNSHNSPSRVARSWGEQPMLIQAQHYALPPYPYASYESFFLTTPQHVGGTLWHSFDHQRGYHPDPFYGGIMDIFRLPKYSYYMFMAQRPAVKNDQTVGSGPMIFIAHEMTPFSGKDVVVYSNCDEVRLTCNKDGQSYMYTKDKTRKGMPSPVIVFPDVFNFMTDVRMSMMERRQDDVYLLAEGLIDGRVVATHKVCPARRPEKLLLWLDNEQQALEANGSDFVTVVASVADKNGNIKRLNNYFVRFQIEGEGRLLGNESIMANPAPVRWGTAPALIQSTLKSGKIKVTASILFEGLGMPATAELEFETVPTTKQLIYNSDEAGAITQTAAVENKSSDINNAKREIERLQKELNAIKLKEVELQQQKFGEPVQNK